MNDEPYVIERMAPYRTPWIDKDGKTITSSYYKVRRGCRNLAQVWACNGVFKRFYFKDGKQAKTVPELPSYFRTTNSATIAVAFLLLWDAYGWETADIFGAATAVSSLLQAVPRQEITETDLFGSILDSRASALPLPARSEA